ncbi:MAG: hypothetical protein E7256_08245 [Lachnospiraceae bacterium]|nr:hypothetical protein [Lachnospiraceae bacterium]
MRRKDLPMKTVYYTDERNDEFSGITRTDKVIDENYTYIHHNPVWRFLSIIVYGCTLPVAYLYSKIKFGIRIEGKEALKPYRKEGYFLCGNHTQVPGDGFMQALVSFPKKNYVIVNAQNVALKGTEQLMLMEGAMPLPTTLKGYKNFLGALDERCGKGDSIALYPEAHIWPYYTGIRNFPQHAFNYPIREKKPVFSFTTIYKKRKNRSTPKIVIKVDGPFWPDSKLTGRQAEKELRDQVYKAMKARSMESDCEYIRYMKRTEEQGQSEKQQSESQKKAENSVSMTSKEEVAASKS